MKKKVGFIAELKRRNVIRVASGYVVSAWLFLQLASIVLPTFEAPPWLMQGVTILLALGFPVAVLLAWFLQFSDAGLVVDEGPDAMPTEAGSSHRWVDFGIIGVLAIAVILFAYDEFVIEPVEISTVERRPAVAVMPFDTDVQASEEEVYLMQALTSELIMRLASWTDFTVLDRAATFNTDLPDDIFEIGGALDARYLVNGQLHSFGETVRITISVTDTITRETVWTNVFDRSFDDILLLEEEISQAIVAQISPQLVASESARAMRADPDDLDAWQAAHRGWWHVNTESQEGFAEAVHWFDRAQELDPNWGWPYAAKGVAMYRANMNGWLEWNEESLKDIFELGSRAVDLDPMNAFSHHALGHAYGTQMRRGESIDSLARGVELNPNDAMAWSCYGMQLAADNQPEKSIAAADRAMALSPNDPWMHRFAAVKARAYFAGGNYEEAQRWALRSNQLKPNFAALIHSIAAAAQTGDIELAQQRVADARAAGRQFPPLQGLEWFFNREAEADYASRVIDGLRLAGLGNPEPEG